MIKEAEKKLMIAVRAANRAGRREGDIIEIYHIIIILLFMKIYFNCNL